MPKYPTTPMCDGTLLEAFEPTTRDTDVFVATSAKCGQTWLCTLLHHLRTGGRDPHFGGEWLHHHVPWLELPLDLSTGQPYEREARLRFVEALPDPRVFKLHVTWEEIPRRAGSQAKILTVTRDPRDVPYSMFRHLHGLVDRMRPPHLSDDFDAYFEQWMEFGYYYKFVRSFWPHRGDPDVLWLRYEDMKRDIEGEARRIVDFLGWDVTDDELRRVLPLVDFGHLRATEKQTFSRGGFKEGAHFFREGAVGKNRARLSAEQERRIVERAREEFDPACFAWVMSQGT